MDANDPPALSEPKPIEHLTNSELILGKPISAIERLKHISATEFEDVVCEWASCLKDKYEKVIGGGGSGDMGRDVIAYSNVQEGKWDNYQCKHYNRPLNQSDVLIEMAKLCYYTYTGEYKLPQKYFFVSPRGPSAKLIRCFEGGSTELKSELLLIWDKKLSEKITTTKKIVLDAGLKKHIEDIDFSMFTYLPPLLLIEQHRQTPYHAPRFGGGLVKRQPSEKPTREIQQMENRYVSQLLEAYSDKEGCKIVSVADLDRYTPLAAHLLRQRESFFSAESLKNFARDNVPSSNNPFDELKDDVYKGIVDTVEATHTNGFERVNATTGEARKLPVHSNILKSRLESNDMPGICHHLANEDKIKWVP